MRRCILMFATVLIATAVTPAIGDEKLTEYRNDTGKFKILFPGKPSMSTVKGMGDVMVQVFAVESGGSAYTINYYDSPNPLRDEDSPKLLDGEIDGFYKALAGKKATQKEIKLQDKHKGAEHTGTITKPADLSVRGRTFIVGQRVYNVLLLGPPNFVTAKPAQQYLDSFQVDK